MIIDHQQFLGSSHQTLPKFTRLLKPKPNLAGQKVDGPMGKTNDLDHCVF